MPKAPTRGDLENLIKLYELRIKKQQGLIRKIISGEYKTVLLPDNMVYGLATGDLNLLQNKLEIYKNKLQALD